MLEIFKSEFQRYRLWAMLAVVAILGIFSFISRLKPFLQPDPGQTALTYMAFHNSIGRLWLCAAHAAPTRKPLDLSDPAPACRPKNLPGHCTCGYHSGCHGCSGAVVYHGWRP